jgi:hypothetical protein
MRARIFTASLLAVLLSTTAVADTSSLNTSITTEGETYGILENNYVRAGVNGVVGTFGSGGNTSPGLLFDSTGTGTFNTSYDYLTPGSPFDGFAVKITNTEGGTALNYTNNNANTKNIDGTGGANLTDGENTLSWSGDWIHNSTTWNITNTYTLGATSPFIDITSTIIAGSDAFSLSFGRFIDPDARAADGDSSATDNVLGYGSLPDSNVAFSEATVSRYALGLYSTDSNVDAGITSPWSSQADSYTESTYTDAEGNPVNYGTGDDTIGLSWAFSGITAGDTITTNYAYIFGPSAFQAASDAVDGGAGGGADVTGGAGVTDVGSATDAAEASSAPTVVSTTSVVGDPTLVSEVEGSATSATTNSTSGSTDITTVTVTTPTTYTYETVTTYTDTMSDGSTQTREETATTTEVKNYVVATETRVTETETTGSATTVISDAVGEVVSDGNKTTATETITYTYITPKSTTTSTITKVSTTDLDGNTTVTESDPVVSNTVFNVTTTEDKVWVTEAETIISDPTITLNSTETVVVDSVTETTSEGTTVTETITVTKRDDVYKTSTTEAFIRTTNTDPDGVVTVTESDVVIAENDYVEPGTAYTEVTTIATTTTEETTTSRVYVDGVEVPELVGVVYHRDYDNQTVETTHGTPVVANGVQTVESDITTTTPTETTTTTTTLMVDTTTTTVTTVTTDPDGTATTVENATSEQDVYNDVDVAVETGEEIIIQDVTSTGRVDQMAAIDVAAGALHRNLGVTNGVGAIGQRTEHDGYTHTSSGFALGGTKITDNGTRFSFGGSLVSTESSADTTTIDSETKHVGLAATFDVNPVIDITLEGNHARSDISYTRNVGTFFNNAGETTATDTWGSVMLKGSGDIVRPVLGYTAGRRTIDGLTETGDSLTALTHATKETDWNYATVGAQLNWDVFSAEALYHTDNTKELNIGIDYNISENTSLKGSTSLSSSDYGSTYGISAGLHIKF